MAGRAERAAGSCPLYGPTLQKVQILQKWSCNPLTYLRNCSFNTPKNGKSAALHTREYRLARLPRLLTLANNIYDDAHACSW